jgi:hypothetical protein
METKPLKTMDNDERKITDTTTRTIATEYGRARETRATVGSHGIVGETKRITLHMN